jgi:hypothetical protein
MDNLLAGWSPGDYNRLSRTYQGYIPKKTAKSPSFEKAKRRSDEGESAYDLLAGWRHLE